MGNHAGPEASMDHELAGFVVQFWVEGAQCFHNLKWMPKGRHRL